MNIIIYFKVQFFCKKNDALMNLFIKVQFFYKKNDALMNLFKFWDIIP